MTAKRKTILIVTVCLWLLSSLLTIPLSGAENTNIVFLKIFVISETMGIFISSLLQIYVIDPILDELHNIRRTSEHDGLTGICNRTRFSRKVEFYNQCQSIGVLFVDVNDLKKTNDLYGHEKGDELIVAVADTIKSLKSETREIDYYRFGGDEFIIVWPNATFAGLEEIQKDLLDKIEKVKLEGISDKCSVAVGTAYKDFGRIDIEILVKNADNKMYEVKKESKKAANR